MSVVMLPSGRFRGFARVRGMKDAQTFDHQKDARTWADKTAERMRKGTWVAPDKTAKTDAPKGLTIAEAWPHYLKSEEWLGKADSTRRSEIPKHIPVLAELGDMLLTELTADDVRAYIAKRRDVKPVRSKDPEAKLSGAQIRLEVAALSAMLAWAIETKKMIDNVTLTVKKPVTARRTDRMPEEIVGKFLNCPDIRTDPKAYAFFMTLFCTGCRPGELSNAKKSWLRDKPPQITLPKTKNDDIRTIVLPTTLHMDIRAIANTTPAECKLIFATKKRFGEGWGPYNYREPWDKGAEFAGIKGTGIVAYTARHEVVSKLFESTDLSDGAIASISGHRSSQALYMYKHLRNEHQRPIINALKNLATEAMLREADKEDHTEGSTLPELQTGQLLLQREESRRKGKGPKWSEAEEAAWIAAREVRLEEEYRQMERALAEKKALKVEEEKVKAKARKLAKKLRDAAAAAAA